MEGLLQFHELVYLVGQRVDHVDQHCFPGVAESFVGVRSQPVLAAPHRSSDVFLEEIAGVLLADVGEFLFFVGLDQVAVADGRVAFGVVVGCFAEALTLDDELLGCFYFCSHGFPISKLN